LAKTAAASLAGRRAVGPCTRLSVWRAPSDLKLPQVLSALSTLISGGIGGLIGKEKP